MWWWNDAWQGWWSFGTLMTMGCVGMMVLMMFFMCGGFFRRQGGSAHDVLERRYDRGEINRGEYEEGRRILGN
jgi:uncharacterized membrane protein